MTREERNIKLKHLIACMKCEVSGRVCDANCPTQYEAGNMGEIIENLKAISEILEQQPCEDCISRQVVLSYIVNDLKFGDEENGYDLERKIAQEEIYNFIKKMPPVTPKEKTGKWIYKQSIFGAVYCSECDFELKTNNTKFCPNCGARMVSE
jgi:hypothetical protein